MVSLNSENQIEEGTLVSLVVGLFGKRNMHLRESKQLSSIDNY